MPFGPLRGYERNNLAERTHELCWIACPFTCERLAAVPAQLPYFFFNDTATTEIYTLSLHDALPISTASRPPSAWPPTCCCPDCCSGPPRSAEHTSELQSLAYIVCRPLLEKKKKKNERRALQTPTSEYLNLFFGH